MAWAKVKKTFQKPIGWWFHKILCELSWYVYKNTYDNNAMNHYYHHLNIMVKKYKINLYGEDIL
jgi:hypothetical protein